MRMNRVGDDNVRFLGVTGIGAIHCGVRHEQRDGEHRGGVCFMVLSFL